MSYVSKNIKKYRVKEGLKQSDLGRLLKKAPSVIANWEAGTNRPDIDSIVKMLEIFKIDANSFFDYDKWGVQGEPLILTDKTEKSIALTYRNLTEENQSAIKKYMKFLWNEQEKEREIKQSETPEVYEAARDGKGFSKVEDEERARKIANVILSGKKSKKPLP